MNKCLIISLMLSCSLLFGCSAREDSIDSNKLESPVLSEENNVDFGDLPSNIDEILKEHSVRLDRLKEFFNKYGLSYICSSDIKDIEVSKLVFDRESSEKENDNLKNINASEYILRDNFKVDSALQLKWEPGMRVSDTVIGEFCKAVTNQDINFNGLDASINYYLQNQEGNDVSMEFELDGYKVVVDMWSPDYVIVSVTS